MFRVTVRLNRIGDIYRRFQGMYTGRPSNFSWFENGKLAACGRPMSIRELEFLKKSGIDTILSLTEEPLPKEWFLSLGMESIHVPMRNHATPTSQSLDEAVNSIEDALRRGGVVAVHCSAGVGRTGTVLAAYLVKSRGLSPERAIGRVRDARPGSIEHEQQTAIHLYQQHIRRLERNNKPQS